MSEAEKLHRHLIGQQGSRRSLNTPALVLDLGLALLEIDDVLVAAAIELHAGIFQRLQSDDLPGQGNRVVGRRHAGAMDAGIDVDNHRLRLAGLRCSRCQRLGVGGMVDHHHQVLDLGVQRHQAIDRLRRHHRRGDVQALDTGLAQRFGLAQLGAADAKRAGGDLAAGNVGRLVGLGMRPEVHLVRLGEGRHLGDVAVEHLEIEHQRRRVQRAPRTLLADEMAVEFLGFAT